MEVVSKQATKVVALSTKLEWKIDQVKYIKKDIVLTFLKKISIAHFPVRKADEALQEQSKSY